MSSLGILVILLVSSLPKTLAMVMSHKEFKFQVPHGSKIKSLDDRELLNVRAISLVDFALFSQ